MQEYMPKQENNLGMLHCQTIPQNMPIPMNLIVSINMKRNYACMYLI